MVAALTPRSLALGLAAATPLAGGNTPSVTDPHSREAHDIATLWWLMAILATVVFVAVMTMVALSLRSRAEDRRAVLEPDPRRSHQFIVIGGLLVPVVVLSVVGVATVATSNALQPRPASVRIVVDAEQWWWRLTYPDEGVVGANEVHVPVGERVELTLRSDNVIHSFWVPQLNGKVDVVPGQTNRMTFTATSAGTYWGQCAEFCGIAHARMAFVVVAQEPADYARWIEANRAPAVAATAGTAAHGEQIFVNSSCAGCHTVIGTSAAGTSGPDLTHFGSRGTIAARTLSNDRDNLARWLGATQDVKPGALMPEIDLSTEEIDQLVAYLEGLK